MSTCCLTSVIRFLVFRPIFGSLIFSVQGPVGKRKLSDKKVGMNIDVVLYTLLILPKHHWVSSSLYIRKFVWRLFLWDVHLCVISSLNAIV